MDQFSAASPHASEVLRQIYGFHADGHSIGSLHGEARRSEARGTPCDRFDLSAAPLRIGTVRLRVRDLQVVEDFYRRIVGLTVLERTAHHAVLGTGGRALLTLHAKADLRDPEPSEAGLHHFAFLMPSAADVACWMVHAIKFRIHFSAASDHRVSEGVYLQDPEGNGIEICADKPRSQWGAQGTRMAMITERLDVHELLDRAGAAEFNGFPPRGCVGHVNLGVGHLRTAEPFYTGVLGLDVTQRLHGATMLARGGYHHNICVNVWQSAGAGRRADDRAGLDSVEFVIKDPCERDGIFARAEAAGVRDGATVIDPWGTRFTLSA